MGPPGDACFDDGVTAGGGDARLDGDAAVLGERRKEAVPVAAATAASTSVASPRHSSSPVAGS